VFAEIGGSILSKKKEDGVALKVPLPSVQSLNFDFLMNIFRSCISSVGKETI
jgi:hypothetical protein